MPRLRLASDTARSSADLASNNAGSPGASPTRPHWTSGHASRASVFACAGILAALNSQASFFQRVGIRGLTNAVLQLGGISVVVWFAMYAALAIGFESAADRLKARDLQVLALVVLLTIAPGSLGGSAALVITAVYLLLTTRPGQPARSVSYILIALTGPLMWGPALLAVLPQPLLAADAHIVAFLIRTPVDGNVVHFVTGGNEFVIAGGCSSIHNMSLALVLWTTAAVLFRLQVTARYLAVGIAMVGLMFVLNIARVAAIGLFPQDYEFLHTGAGGGLFAWAGFLGSSLLASIGVLRGTPNSQ